MSAILSEIIPLTLWLPKKIHVKLEKSTSQNKRFSPFNHSLSAPLFLFFFWLQYIRMKVSQKCFAPDIEKENVEPESQGHSPLTVTNWMPNPCLS